MEYQTMTKMLISLWKWDSSEKSVFEVAAASQEHVKKHGKEQQLQVPTFSNQKNACPTEEEEEETPMVKNEKMNEDEGKMPKQVSHRRKVIVYMAIEVWVDVFGFIKRIQLARTVSLTNRLIHKICWPRLHGNNVKARWVRKIVFGSRDEFDGHMPTALTLKHGTGMPLVSWPAPDYISGFDHITIKFLDQQVLELLANIYPRIATNNYMIMSLSFYKELFGKQRVFMDQLMDIFCKGLLKIHFYINSSMASSIQMFHDIENKVEKVELFVIEKPDIPIVMKMLAIPRSDGQQRVISLYFRQRQHLAQEMLDAIKKEFHAATQPLPQPFFIRLRKDDLDFVEMEEENLQTGETLRAFEGVGRSYQWDICRHPNGQHEHLVEDGGKRLQIKSYNQMIFITVKF